MIGLQGKLGQKVFRFPRFPFRLCILYMMEVPIMKNQYLLDVLETVRKRNPGEPEFI